MSFFASLHIRTKILLLAVIPVLVALAATVATLLIQQQRLGGQLDATIRNQATEQAGKIAHSVYLLCAATELRTQRELSQDIETAQALLQQAGGIKLGTTPVRWTASNQLSGEQRALTLPALALGDQVLQDRQEAGFVDEVTRVTGHFCTVFQRMNDQGDMLRVSTSVRTKEGARATGTYIPAQNVTGAANPVIASVLQGRGYRGRALVLNTWHAAAYEPLWDASRTRVIGMLYLGIELTALNEDLRKVIGQMVVGRTGYAFVLGGSGAEQGRYLVSPQGKRDGESIWEARDAGGRLFIQDLVKGAKETRDGQAVVEAYAWQNAGEAAPREKFAAVTYFAPWDWVIGAGAYADDYQEVRAELATARTRMVSGVSGAAALVALLAVACGIAAARGISNPITRVIRELNGGAGQVGTTAQQMAESSETLAQGGSEQAASLEETSASLQQMSGMTARNAENATRARRLAEEATTAATAGVAEMEAMSAAMSGIAGSGAEIAKIIKTIDEIAFQTNILALNAAVEAARAGESGQGFAVVADEVRTLAQRSAVAARETAGKIEGSLARTEQGVAINRRVAERLGEIVTKVRDVNDLVAQVAAASQDQSSGVNQITGAIQQMDAVVQNNAVVAEQGAAAATELSGQADALVGAVAQLARLIGESNGGAPTTARTRPAGLPVAESVAGSASERVRKSEPERTESLALSATSRRGSACLSSR